MTSGEIPISRIKASDAVFYDGKIHVVRGCLRISHPSRTILFTQEGQSILLTDGTLIERVDQDLTTSGYLGPTWVCGLPEKTEVAALESGDLILNPEAEIVVSRLKTANGYVLISRNVVEPHASRITFQEPGTRIRLMAKGLGPRSSTEHLPIDMNALELFAGEVTLPAQLVSESGVVSVQSIANEGDFVIFVTDVGSTMQHRLVDPVICLEPIPEPEPTKLVTQSEVFDFRCVNGHVTRSDQPVAEGERFTECLVCGLPATADAKSPSTKAAKLLEQPAVANFCGFCGRARKISNAFCTGCGQRFSKIETTGFQ